MATRRPDQGRPITETDPPIDEPREPRADQHDDIAPDLSVEPEPPAESEEDVRRMWEASDPIEGEAPTG